MINLYIILKTTQIKKFAILGLLGMTLAISILNIKSYSSNSNIEIRYKNVYNKPVTDLNALQNVPKITLCPFVQYALANGATQTTGGLTNYALAYAVKGANSFYHVTQFVPIPKNVDESIAMSRLP